MKNKKGTGYQETEHSTSDTKDNWPRRLNRILIGVGVIAFGLIIADRLVSMYKTEDTTASSVAAVGSSQTTGVIAVEKEPDTTVVVGEATPIERDVEVQDLQSEFGSRLLFVSVADPKYIITVDERRFDIGSSIDEKTTLAGITDSQVILDKDGNLKTYDLPEPVAE